MQLNVGITSFKEVLSVVATTTTSLRETLEDRGLRTVGPKLSAVQNSTSTPYTLETMSTE